MSAAGSVQLSLEGKVTMKRKQKQVSDILKLISNVKFSLLKILNIVLTKLDFYQVLFSGSLFLPIGKS